MTKRDNLIMLLEQQRILGQKIDSLIDKESQVTNAIEYMEAEIQWDNFISYCQTTCLTYR